ncbi:hypothetical protein Q9S36_40060 [Microbacterium sp. ARD31]|uniref:hypothetical protein n=1 Tax=Microbacterium sp. ARD31 TaxID=2962576 RepID=UPI0028822FD1|nr:hypothetical protein [Microbacterium sp. ARD31]MDT0186399.1 hypothetical protein [Microbacterium sp. ARD31]
MSVDAVLLLVFAFDQSIKAAPVATKDRTTRPTLFVLSQASLFSIMAALLALAVGHSAVTFWVTAVGTGLAAQGLSLILSDLAFSEWAPPEWLGFWIPLVCTAILIGTAVSLAP